jgi:hypothetical protein
MPLEDSIQQTGGSLRRIIAALMFLLPFLLPASAQQTSTPQTPPVAYFVDTSGRNYLKFSTNALPQPSATTVACGVQFGGTKAAISIVDDRGQAFSMGPSASSWDSAHNQGIAAFYGPPGGLTFTATASSSVNYVTIACVSVDAGALDLSAAAISTKLIWNASTADNVIAFIAEDSTSSGDTFAPGAGFNLAKNDGAHGFAVEIGSGNPAFSLTPSGKSALVVALAFQPSVAPSTQAMTLNVKLTFEDGTPVQAALRFQQSFGGTWTDLTTITLDATGSARGTIPLSLQQGDPVSLQITIFDADGSGAWPQATPMTLPLSQFKGVSTLNYVGTANRATKMLNLPLSWSTQ